MPEPLDIEVSKELRQQSTDAEKKLWDHLRDRRLGGYKFRRQYPLFGYVLDFYCPEARLAVEVDGSIHKEDLQKHNDRIRTENLRSMDVELMRFWNNEVLNDIENVLTRIQNEVIQRIDRHGSYSTKQP